jgi:hypothetical protein
MDGDSNIQISHGDDAEFVAALIAAFPAGRMFDEASVLSRTRFDNKLHSVLRNAGIRLVTVTSRAAAQLPVQKWLKHLAAEGVLSRDEEGWFRIRR